MKHKIRRTKKHTELQMQKMAHNLYLKFNSSVKIGTSVWEYTTGRKSIEYSLWVDIEIDPIHLFSPSWEKLQDKYFSIMEY